MNIHGVMSVRATELEESGAYYEARVEAFDAEFKDAFSKHFGTKLGMHISVSEADVKGFLDSFTFPDEYDWIANKVSDEYEAYCDQKYQEMKDNTDERAY